jgi:hypothetical protein
MHPGAVEAYCTCREIGTHARFLEANSITVKVHLGNMETLPKAEVLVQELWS